LTALIVSVLVVALLWFVWRFVGTLWTGQQPAEPIDPDSLVPADHKRGLGGRGAAVAVQEPDDDDLQSFPPRYQ
jgi:hypothetical protein